MKETELDRITELCITDFRKSDIIWNNRIGVTKYILNWMYDYMCDKYKLIV